VEEGVRRSMQLQGCIEEGLARARAARLKIDHKEQQSRMEKDVRRSRSTQNPATMLPSVVEFVPISHNIQGVFTVDLTRRPTSPQALGWREKSAMVG
jgi:hypothetical protein